MNRTINVNIDGKDVEVTVFRPTPVQSHEATKVYSLAFSRGLKDGLIVRKKLWEHLISNGIWSEELEQEKKRLESEVIANQAKLAKGGIKLNEARSLAIKMRINRMKLKLLMHHYNEYDKITVEAIAEQEKFDYLVSVCVKDSKGKNLFASVEKYREFSDTDYAYKIATVFSELYYGLEESYLKDLPENKFLSQFGFVNEKMQLVDANNRLIDEDGKLINENGDYVDENGKVLNDDGETVQNDEFTPFLNDDGTVYQPAT